MFKQPDLASHQKKAVKELGNGKILRGGVGTGKSRTALAYFCEKIDPPWTKLYIITTARKRDSKDWEDEACAFGLEPVVDSWNNMGKYTEVENAFFIFDEQRLVGSGVWVAAFLLLARRNRWILLSATPGDSWMDYIPVFIANGFYKNRTDFVRRHVVFKQWSKYPQVDRFVDESILKSLRRRITVEMPYERKTRRHMEYVYCDWDREQYETIFRRRWNPWKSEPIRQIAGSSGLPEAGSSTRLGRQTRFLASLSASRSSAEPSGRKSLRFPEATSRRSRSRNGYWPRAVSCFCSTRLVASTSAPSMSFTC